LLVANLDILKFRTYVLNNKTLTISSPAILNLFNFRHIEGDNYEILGYQGSQPATKITIRDRKGLRGKTVSKADKGVISLESVVLHLDSGIFFALYAGDLEQSLFEQILSTFKFIETGEETQSYYDEEEEKYCQQFSYDDCPLSTCEVGPSCPVCRDVGCNSKNFYTSPDSPFIK